MILSTQPESITEADLQALADDQVPESKTIDYKLTLPGNSYEDKREFLADVSSFANASGGHLVFGMKEEDGLAKQLCGLRGLNQDDEILRLENVLRDAIEPRIPGVSTCAIPLHASGFAIVIYVPRSWAQPHVVKLRRHWRFYSRNSAGKYPLHVSELRAAFLLSGTIAERIRLFRVERLGKIVAHETPIQISGGAAIVLHMVPVGAFDPTAGIEVAELYRLSRVDGRLGPIYTSGWNHFVNFDGLVTHSGPDNGGAGGYVQVFRNGSIEAVDTRLLRPGPIGPSHPGEMDKYYSAEPVERHIVDAVRGYLLTQAQIGVALPVFVMLTLLGVRGYTLLHGQVRSWPSELHRIDRDQLILPEAVVDDFDSDVPLLMKARFDAIWNAMGLLHSINYDQDGQWCHR